MKGYIAPSIMSGIARSNYARMDASSGNAAQQAMQANNLARALITGRSIKMTQQIYSNTVNPANTNILNIVPRNVGLILGFFVECNFALADPGAGNSYTLSPFGPANVLQQIVFNDLNNNVRIQTSGWHTHFINSVKKRRPFASVSTFSGLPIAYGNNFGGNLAANQAQNIIQAATTYDHTHFAQGVQMMYWVPLAYSDFDLRGAIYANVVNATMNLQLTITPSATAFGANAADPTLAVYNAGSGSSGGAWGTACTVNVYQVYYDQLPVASNGAPVLPIMDLSTIYELKNTSLTGVTVNQDFPIPYSNFRDFLSTVAVFDNQTGGAYPAAGSDIAYWALQSANFTNIFKVTPKYVGLWDRSEINSDFPGGVYYFPSRDKPISTVQYGNLQLILNASTINGTPSVLMGYEDFALTNTLVGAASLAGS
jgi:hypothetical protein